MVLYHGTSTEYRELIRTQGIRPRCETGQPSNWKGPVESKSDLVYLTSCYPVYFASCAINEVNDEFVHDLLILEVNVDPNNLFPDEDFVAYIAKEQGLKKPLHDINPLIDPRQFQHLAELSLKYNGVVSVDCVPATHVVREVVIPVKEAWSILAIGGDAMPIPMNFAILGKMYQQAMQALFDEGLAAAVAVSRKEHPAEKLLTTKNMEILNRPVEVD